MNETNLSLLSYINFSRFRMKYLAAFISFPRARPDFRRRPRSTRSASGWECPAAGRAPIGPERKRGECSVTEVIGHCDSMKAMLRENKLIVVSLYSGIHLLCLKRFWSWGFGEFPRLVGCYCSYLLPKQALATFSQQPNKTLRQTGWIALYTGSYWCCLIRL